MSLATESGAIGADRPRVDGIAKVTGAAQYAVEHDVERPLHLFAVLSPIARGRVTAIDADEAAALPGVTLLLTHENAPRIETDNRELAVLQSPEIAFRGQIVAAALATTPEIARDAASRIHITYETDPHDVVLDAEGDGLSVPEQVNGGFATDTADGDVDAALASAAVVVDATYTTPMEHQSSLEPHSSTALWQAGELIMYDSTQAVHSVRRDLAPLFGLEPEQVRVVAPYIGGGFGSKGLIHANVVLCAMAARAVEGSAVRFALTRQATFTVGGHRTPTVQRVRLGADADGRITALAHDAVSHTSRIKEFAEQTAVPGRMMYAGGARRTTHRLAELDVPVPTWMRAPGETPGMFALESAMDELAVAAGLDPIELRVRNEPETDPEDGRPWSSRNLVACLHEGAERFGWARREARRDGRWRIGSGVASSTYPAKRLPGSEAVVRRLEDGGYHVAIGAADLGTGAWTALGQIAAEALGVPIDHVGVAIGDTSLPMATVAGGSMGTASWGTAILAAVEALRGEHGDDPPPGAEARGRAEKNPAAATYSMHSFGAQFAEVRVHELTGEVRVDRLLGVFATGRIVNPRTGRSQFIGGMTMGLGMALLEEVVLDQELGGVVTKDLASYHVASHADVPAIEVHWLDEHDPHVNDMGIKGIGEIGIVGTAAAIANAVFHATGVRMRELPITPDRVLSALSPAAPPAGT